MAYFLKKTKQKNKTYLAIYESYYNSEKKETAHRSFKSLGSIETLKNQGIDDPIEYYQKEVDELNRKKKATQSKKITKKPPVYHLGYFPLKSLMESFHIKEHIDLYRNSLNYDFDLYELFSTLIYISATNSKQELIKYTNCSLFEGREFSKEQILHGLSILGSVYPMMTELFLHQMRASYQVNDTLTYFDCINFPLNDSNVLALGILFDENIIPCDFRFYQGSKQGKPPIQDSISYLKRHSDIKAKTIRVGGKETNCEENIALAIQNDDGYIFSSIPSDINDNERAWMLDSSDYHEVKNSDGILLYKYKSIIKKTKYIINGNSEKEIKEKRLVVYYPDKAKEMNMDFSIHKESTNNNSTSFIQADSENNTFCCLEKAMELAGYSLIITSEYLLDDKELLRKYRNIHRMEDIITNMERNTDMYSGVYEKEDYIKGFFLVCFISIMLERILEVHIFDNKYPMDEILDFYTEFKLAKGSNDEYINLSTTSSFLMGLEEKTSLPLTSYFLNKQKMKTILNYKF